MVLTLHEVVLKRISLPNMYVLSMKPWVLPCVTISTWPSTNVQNSFMFHYCFTVFPWPWILLFALSLSCTHNYWGWENTKPICTLSEFLPIYCTSNVVVIGVCISYCVWPIYCTSNVVVIGVFLIVFGQFTVRVM